MPWRRSLNRLRDTLAELYPHTKQIRRVAAAASLPLGQVVLHGEPVNDWQAILEEALRRDYVEEIIEAARADHPRHRGLLMAVEAYRLAETRPQRTAKAEPPPPAAPPTEPAAPTPLPEAMPTTADALLLELGDGVTLKLVRVPAGEFLMGSSDSDPLARDDEKPQHKLWLPRYLIGKHPVTVAQYRAFVQATSYDRSDADVVSEPGDHPMTGVSWVEATAFCDWAAYVTGRFVSLPSEAEWEKAARGTDGRIYPWGNRWDPARCNSEERGPGHTTPVGLYSLLGDSPYGCTDMAGNAWEWTRSLWGADAREPDFRYPYRPDDGRENGRAANAALRVLRGGAYYSNDAFVRCALREAFDPREREASNGFRVVVLASAP